jgi:hypothetical protein
MGEDRKRKKVQLKSGTYRLNLLVLGNDINPFESDEDFLSQWENNAIGFIDDLIPQRNEALTQYHELLYKFNSFSEIFTIYRYIGVDNFEEFYQALLKGKYIEKFKGIGIYWAWDWEIDFESLESTEGTYLVRLMGKINKDDVDWKETLLANTHPEFSLEREITLIEGSVIIIDELEFSELSDVIYYYSTFPESYSLPNIEIVAKIGNKRRNLNNLNHLQINPKKELTEEEKFYEEFFETEESWAWDFYKLEISKLNEFDYPFLFELFLDDWKTNSHDTIIDRFDFYCKDQSNIDCLKTTEKRLLNDIKTFYNSFIDRNSYINKFEIYRVIGIEEDEIDVFIKKIQKGKLLKGKKGLGTSWSNYKENAIDFSTREVTGKIILMTAIVKDSDINWAYTILLNSNLSIGEEECEFSLKNNIKIDLKKIEILDENKTIAIDQYLPV